MFLNSAKQLINQVLLPFEHACLEKTFVSCIDDQEKGIQEAPHLFYNASFQPRDVGFSHLNVSFYVLFPLIGLVQNPL